VISGNERAPSRAGAQRDSATSSAYFFLVVSRAIVESE
jgi:hypothetical protein